MEQDKKSKRTNNRILPLAAGIMAVIAILVVLFVPKNTVRENDAAQTVSEANESDVPRTADDVADLNEEGRLVIYADRLSPDQVSFIGVSEDSRIELLSRLGDDGKAKAALGTCLSCNGSPNAYYTQEGSELMCNNCGLTFPVSVLDSPGGGCHPIMIEEELMQYDGNDLVIDLKGLSVYEELFSEIAEH